MAYVEIHTREADFRWLLGGHWKKINPKQLPPQFTGLALELIYDNPAHFYQDLEGNPQPTNDLVVRQFPSLIAESKKSQIPIISLDPITKIDDISNRMSLDKETISEVVKKHPSSMLQAMIASFIIDFYPGEIKPGNWLYDSMVRQRDIMTSYGYPIISFRDLAMAQRASALAKYQLSHGVERPLIVAASGTLHIGATKHLELTSEERWKRIRTDPSFREYAAARQAGRIHSIQFNERRGTWVKGIIEDQSAPRR